MAMLFLTLASIHQGRWPKFKHIICAIGLRRPGGPT